MHELNICLNIIDLIEQQSKANNFQHVKKLWLEIGELAGIEIDALRFCFPIAARESVAQHAELLINTVPGQAWCQLCCQIINIKKLFDCCHQCGQYEYEIQQGKVLRVLKVEVE